MRSFLSVLALVALCAPAQAHGVAVVRVRAFVPFTPVVSVPAVVATPAVAVDSCGVQAQFVAPVVVQSAVVFNPFFTVVDHFASHVFFEHGRAFNGRRRR